MRRDASSLTWRIARRLTAIVIVAAAIAYGLLFWQVWSSASAIDRNDALNAAEDLAAKVESADGRVVVTDPGSIAGPQDVAAGIVRYTVTDDAGAIVAASPWPTAPQADPGKRLYLASHASPAGHRFYGAVLRKTIDGRQVTVQVERQSDDPTLLVESVLDEFFEHGTWILAVVMAALLAIAIVATRDAMSVLTVLSRDAAALGSDQPGRRLSEKGVPREALSLVRAVNTALARLDAALAQQREFAADAAHELRNPLSVLRAQVDSLADATAANALRGDIEHMARVVDQLLKIAQIDSFVMGADEGADLKAAAMKVASLLIPTALAEDKSIDLVLPEAGGQVRGNLDAIVLALRNLVENAIRYAPAGSCVEIVVDAGGAVAVVDRGPGIPVALRQRVFERFWRADRAGVGTGLGLAIVAKVMELHGGRAEVAETPGGGTTMTLRFRPVAAPSVTVAAPIPPADAA